MSGANPSFKLGNTNASGAATINDVGVNTGIDTVVATATVASTLFTSNPAKVTWASGAHATSIDVNASPTGGTVGTQSMLTAALFDRSVSPVAPVVGATVSLSVGNQFCSAITNANGVASCSLTPATAGSFTLTASYFGNAQYSLATVSTSVFVTAVVG